MTRNIKHRRKKGGEKINKKISRKKKINEREEK